ncbi:MAG TPA: site-2 protease family protein, partial [Candidatus Saccharibacteria bacterium]|nr:site-2 protease family protein [Candidatus Saccharibacteria bacterium]
ADIATGLVMQLSSDQATQQEASAKLGRVGDSVAGPIGILAIIFPAAEQAGIIQILFLTAIISLTLAVMNALPIPALDGGRWFTTVIFKLFRQKLTREKEEYIQGVGFIILILLIILVTVSDVTKLFS